MIRNIFDKIIIGLWLCFILDQSSVVAQEIIIRVEPTVADTLEIYLLNHEGIKALKEPNGWLNAISSHSKALQKSQSVNYLKGEATSLRYLALAEGDQPGRRLKAIDYLLLEIKVREQIGDQALLADAYEQLGDFMVNVIHYPDEGIGYLQQAIKLRRVVTPFAIQILDNLAKIAKAYSYLGEKQKAIQYLMQVSEEYQKREQYEEASMICIEVSRIYFDQDLFQEALLQIQKAKNIYQKTGKPMLDQFLYSEKTIQYKINEENSIKNSRLILTWIIVGVVVLSLGIFSFFWFRHTRVKS
jgi:tetratricopeptide (TPR) repeat protein